MGSYKSLKDYINLTKLPKITMTALELRALNNEYANLRLFNLRALATHTNSNPITRPNLDTFKIEGIPLRHYLIVI